MDEEHRDHRAVLGSVAHLLDLEALAVDRHAVPGPDRPLAGRDVVAVDRRGYDERVEGEEGFLAAPLAAHPGKRTDLGKRDLSERLSVGVEDLDLRDDVLEIAHEEPAAHRGKAGEGLGTLGHDFLPVVPGGLLEVHGEDAPARRLPVRFEIEAVAGDGGRKSRLDVVDDRTNRAGRCPTSPGRRPRS